MVLPLRVLLQLFPIEIDFAQISRAVALHLILEVERLRMSAFPAGRHRPGTYLIPKLHHRHKAISARSVPLLRSCSSACFLRGIGSGPERSQRAPGGRREPHRSARLGIVEAPHDVPSQALKAIDFAPWRLPAPEIRSQLI